MALPQLLLHRLEATAAREGKSPEALLESLLDAYERATISTVEEERSLENIIGIFDDDITDLSITVRETRTLFRPH